MRTANVDLRLADCLDILPTLSAGSVDAVVTDPPYGQDYEPKFMEAGARPGLNRPNVSSDNNKWKKIHGDMEYPDIKLLTSIGKVQVVFGAHIFYHLLPEGGSLIVWDKKEGDYQGWDAGDGEAIWCSKPGMLRIYHHLWMGLVKKHTIKDIGGANRKQLHPTEKPLPLMEWLIDRYTNPGDTVLDPFMGSGTTGVACMKLGRNFIGIEKDEGYFKIAERRIAQAQAQLVLPLFGP